MTLYAFLIISANKILNFIRLLQKRDIRTDGPTDRRTDRPSFRDARTYLKSLNLLTRSFVYMHRAVAILSTSFSQFHFKSDSQLATNVRVPACACAQACLRVSCKKGNDSAKALDKASFPFTFGII